MIDHERLDRFDGWLGANLWRTAWLIFVIVTLVAWLIGFITIEVK